MVSTKVVLVALLLVAVTFAQQHICFTVEDIETNPLITASPLVFPYCLPYIAQAGTAGLYLPLNAAGDGLDPEFEAAATSIYAIARVLGVGPEGGNGLTTKTCIDKFLHLHCQFLLGPCAEIAPGFYLPQAPCRPVCDVVFDDCRDQINASLFKMDPEGHLGIRDAIDLVVPPCMVTYPDDDPLRPDQEYFPETVQTWEIEGNQIPVPCAELENAPSEHYPCWRPFTRISDKRENGYCDLECPKQLFPNGMFRQLWIFQSVIGWIGWIGSAVLFVTMMFLPRYRHYPANLVVWMVFASHTISFGFVFPSMYGFERMMCKDSTTHSTKSDSACVFQSLNFLFGALCLPCFWCAIAINSFIAIFLKKDRIFKTHGFILEIVTHVLCWGIPTVACIIALATGRLGFPTGVTFCWFIAYTDDKGYDTFNWDLALFFSPVGLFTLIGFLSICFVLWEMRNLKAAAGQRKYTKHIRLVLFLLVFLCVYVFIFAYRFYAEKDSPHWTDNYVAWAECSVLQPTGCTRGENNIKPAMYWFFLFFSCGQAVLLTILFGSNPDIVSFWRDRYHNVKEGRSFFQGVTSAQSAQSAASKD